MTNTKKGFLTAGSIIAIVFAGVGLLMSILLFSLGANITEKQMVKMYTMDETVQYIENEEDGSYVLKFFDEETGEEIETMTEEEIEIIAKVVKGLLIFAACTEIALDVAILPIAILLLKSTNKKEEKKGLTIALLVMSVLSGDIVTLAFMIVALCLKNKQSEPAYQQITIE